jgi:hypothetical protein
MRRSPTFSPETPRLTQVLRAHTDAPQEATWIFVLPSARAQSPRYAGCVASETPLAPIVMSAANGATLPNMARPSPADPLHSRVNSRQLEFLPRLTP